MRQDKSNLQVGYLTIRTTLSAITANAALNTYNTRTQNGNTYSVSQKSPP